MTLRKTTVRETDDLGFAVGDHVVYPTHGVGKITGLETQEIAGTKLRLFVCLLYTSPSPRDLSTSRMPSSA